MGRDHLILEFSVQRRPTIPIADWRIATNLAATRAVQGRAENPAEGCDCEWCRNWYRAASLVLPPALKEQVERFGVQVEHPTDLYAFQVLEQGAHCRVIYHVVGKLLSGPSVFVETPGLGEVLNYKEIRSGPNFIMLAVLRCRNAFDSKPVFVDVSAGDLLQIDLRLFVPLHSTLLHEAGQ